MVDNWPVPQIDAARCNGCGLCVRACTHGALATHDGRVSVIYPQACAYDGACEQICPQQAIARRFQVSTCAPCADEN